MRVLLFLFIFGLSANVISQSNQYEPVQCTQLNNQNKNDYNGLFWGHECVETNGVVNFDSDQNYSIKAGEYIHIYNETTITPDNNHQFHAYIEEDAIDIGWYEPLNTFGGVGRYEKMEIGIGLPQHLEDEITLFEQTQGTQNVQGINPFLEWEIKVTAYFEHESGLTKSVDAFYYRHYERNIVPYDTLTMPWPIWDQIYETVGGTWEEHPTDHKFRVRFAPSELGNWKCYVKVVTPNYDYTSGLFDFIVYNSNNPGFVEVGSNNRYLVRGGSTYMPVGPNYISETKPNLNPETLHIYGGIGEAHRPPPQPLQSFLDYEQNLSLISNSGANHFRFFMCPWAYEIEFEDIGNYYERMTNAYEMDELLNTAKDLDLTIQFNMLVHYPLTTYEYNVKWWDWSKESDYPYTLEFNQNYTDGGYCYRENEHFAIQDAEDFFWRSEAKKYYKQRVRYIISRWGYSTEIEMFELMSEMNNVGNFFNLDGNTDPPGHSSPYGSNLIVQHTVSTWTNEISTYIKENLGHDEHLIAVSYSNEIGELDYTYTHDNIDIAGRNKYPDERKYPSFWHDIVKPSATIQNIQYMEDRTTQLGTLDPKPLIFAECGELNTFLCADGVAIEKTIWIPPFTGLALGNDWTIMFNPHNMYHYQDVLDFIDGRDFDGENWIPGQWVSPINGVYGYHNNPWNKMKGDNGKISMFYLRKGDKTEALGVINNRTYNYYTAASDPLDNNCLEEPDYLLNTFNTYVNNGEIDQENNGLQLRKMLNSNYQIKYYDTDGTFLGSSFDNGPNVKVEYPSFSQGFHGGIICFEANVLNSMAPFNNLEDDPEIENGDIEKVLEGSSIEQINIYPNPCNLYTLINSPFEEASLRICDFSGKELESINLIFGINKIETYNLASGTYLFIILTENEAHKFSVVRN